MARDEALRAKLALTEAGVGVREPDEYASAHIPDALHVPLGQLAKRGDEVPDDRPIAAYCLHGERAATAVSLLERSGRAALLNLAGGIDAWRDAGYCIANYRLVLRSYGLAIGCSVFAKQYSGRERGA